MIFLSTEWVTHFELSTVLQMSHPFLSVLQDSISVLFLFRAQSLSVPLHKRCSSLSTPLVAPLRTHHRVSDSDRNSLQEHKQGAIITTQVLHRLTVAVLPSASFWSLRVDRSLIAAFTSRALRCRPLRDIFCSITADKGSIVELPSSDADC